MQDARARGGDDRPDGSSEDAARRFIAGFNGRDLDLFASSLHPDVLLHASRGDRVGVASAREWATRPPGGVQQTILLEELLARGSELVALVVREWRWDDPEANPDELAGREEMAWWFRFEDGLVAEWRPYEDRAEAAARLDSG